MSEKKLLDEKQLEEAAGGFISVADIKNFVTGDSFICKFQGEIMRITVLNPIDTEGVYRMLLVKIEEFKNGELVQTVEDTVSNALLSSLYLEHQISSVNE